MVLVVVLLLLLLRRLVVVLLLLLRRLAVVLALLKLGCLHGETSQAQKATPRRALVQGSSNLGAGTEAHAAHPPDGCHAACTCGDDDQSADHVGSHPMHVGDTAMHVEGVTW